MEKINLYILNLTLSHNISGVNRYIEILTSELKKYSFIKVHRILLVEDPAFLFWKEEVIDNCTDIQIPLPQEGREIINELYWHEKYNAYVFSLIKHIFENKSNCILHVNTLNLIALASYIKQRVSCSIITHLHCLPWKTLYKINTKRFNKLYNLYHLKEDYSWKEPFLTHNCELNSYIMADHIICVTESGRNFLKNLMKIPDKNISTIYNGINDHNPKNKKRELSADIFQCLFVGTITECKGILYLLRSLRIIQSKGYKIMLNMAGYCRDSFKEQIMTDFCDLQLNFLGKISFEELQIQYLNNDIGILSSIHEQCSYVAIEMTMFGLPLVVTAVDGLDEMFIDEKNALKTNMIFSNTLGLRVDTNALADNIIELIENKSLRSKLRKNSRKLYEEKFTSEKMINETIQIYKKLTYE